ncbi:MAG: hypothetical protein JNM55_04005 [Anaerolineales bacterium]|nr:hypothetical protein [Anaerolineales bacterium]
MNEKVKLHGGLEKTVTWVWLEEGALKVEYYDFSEAAQDAFGNDIAYILTVNDMKKFYKQAECDESSIIQLISGKFSSYFDIKRWLEAYEIDFEKQIDHWA